MAKDTLFLDETGNIQFGPLGGVDEAKSDVDWSDAQTGKLVFKPIVSVRGVLSFFQGAHQRMTGKKIIDYNPGQKVMGICQTFNGVCQYGYYVQTQYKLYYHLCSAPPDMRIHWIS